MADHRSPSDKRIDFVMGWIFVAVMAFLVAVSMTGCNTVKGMAKDIYSVTEGIQNEMATDSDRDGVRPDSWD